MKKSLGFPLLLVLCSFGASAQSFTWGLKAGWSASNFRAADHAFTGKKDNLIYPDGFVHGLTAGVEVGYRMSDRFRVLSAMQYAHKGHPITISLPAGGREDGIQHFHYLDMNVVGDVRIIKGLSIQCGVQPSLLLDARTVSETQNFNTEEFFNIYKSLDVGLLAGIQYDFGTHIYAQARWVQGLAPILSVEFTDETGQTVDAANFYNQNLQISAGYRF